MKKLKIIFTILFVVIAVATTLLLFTYLKFLPFIISNDKFENFIATNLKNKFNTEFILEKPVLKTALNPNIEFTVKKLALSKNKEVILDVENFDTEISLRKIFRKNIIVKKLGADYIFADIEKIQNLIPEKQEEKQNKSDWTFDLFHSLLYIKDCEILYNAKNDFNMRILGNNLIISETRNPKPFKFNILVEIEKNNKKIKIKLSDNNTVFTNENKLFAKNMEFYINNSKVTVNYVGRRDRTFDLNVHAKKFNFAYVEDLIKSDFFVPDGSKLLAPIENLTGNFDFDFNLSNNDMNGNFNINSLSLLLPDARNLPVTLTTGKLNLTKNKISLDKFEGYYGKNNINKFDLKGVITEYTTNPKIDIVSFVDLTKELTNNYLSPLVNYPIELVGKSKAKVKFNMINNVMNISVIFRLISGYDILFDKVSFTPTSYQRAFKADVVIDKNNIELKNLNYYIAKEFQAGVKADPLLRMYGNFNSNGAIKNLGFEIPKPLRSEFMNAIFKQRIFKEGFISGNLKYINTNKVPMLQGNLAIDKVKIPSQRMLIKNAILNANGNILNITASGRYKRSDYNFVASVLNEMKPPFIVKDINLKIDNLDLERVMKSVNNMPENQQYDTIAQKLADTEENQAKSDDEVSFDTNNFIVEHCLLEIVKGVYKQIDFGNVQATMTLDKNGIFDLYSNRFDIAEGISSAKINCDFKKQIYKLRLGIKDVNADVIATSLLNLPKEISGKARGFILIETDKTMQLNGEIKFDIKKGNIAKVGLIEYALNFVALFRNPLAMISPATLFDLVNVPEGEFDKIEGTLNLKDNIINRMMIKSYAPQLSSFIVGRYDLINSDATLRIYTKFSNKHKGLAGALRYISLNSFANKVPLSNKNEANYYTLELSQIPDIDAPEKDCQVYLTKIDGDVEHNNFLSTLKRIK